MLKGTVFIENNKQLISIPADAHFAKSVKKVVIRVVGNERVITPVDSLWDSFFHAKEGVTEDFMNDRTENYC